MKKRNINIHTLIVISSTVLFSLALLACPEISSNKNKPLKQQSKQTTKILDPSNLQSSPQYIFSDIFSKILYDAAKNQNVPDDTIVDEDTSNAARTIFNALGVKAGDALNFRYVKSTGNDTNDGTTWTKAKLSIEATLKDIKDASTNKPYLVLIGAGTYTPAETLSMKNHVAIIGGFHASSNEASGYERNSKTTISGEKKRQVFYNTNLNTSAILAHVTINEGKKKHGGGMYNSNSSPIIIHTTFSGNNALIAGGMFNANSSPTISHTTFSKNTASQNGGGMFNLHSSPMIIHNTFSGNIASQYGGGMINSKSSPTISHTTFSKNTASQNGGGMFNYHSSPTIIHTTFLGNTASQNGGGMYNLSKSSPTISSSIFWGNTKNNNTHNQIENDTISFPVVAHSIVQGGYKNGTSIITKDPGLQPLADNGGFIETIAIKTGSSAINQGLYGAHKGNVFYYSSDGTTWFTDPTLNEETPLALRRNKIHHRCTRL